MNETLHAFFTCLRAYALYLVFLGAGWLALVALRLAGRLAARAATWFRYRCWDGRSRGAPLVGARELPTSSPTDARVTAALDLASEVRLLEARVTAALDRAPEVRLLEARVSLLEEQRRRAERILGDRWADAQVRLEKIEGEVQRLRAGAGVEPKKDSPPRRRQTPRQGLPEASYSTVQVVVPYDLRFARLRSLEIQGAGPPSFPPHQVSLVLRGVGSSFEDVEEKLTYFQGFGVEWFSLDSGIPQRFARGENLTFRIFTPAPSVPRTLVATFEEAAS